jgi:glutamate racemase
VRDFSEQITRFLLSQGSKLIVVACNTASAAALFHLRETFPDIPFVGMEPAVKPAAETTHSGVVGVLATPATFQGELYASVVARFARQVRVLQDTCPGLVSQIEKGDLDSIQTQTILENALHPMLKSGIDRVVLGCTHYPFVIPLIKKIIGPQVEVVDPAPAVARQVGRVLRARGLLNMRGLPGELKCFSTKTPNALEPLLPGLLGEACPVQQLDWHQGALYVR